MRRRLLGFGISAIMLAALSPAAGSAPLATPQDRSVDPVVLTGGQFPTWSAGPDVTFREPQAPVNYDVSDPPVHQSDCYRASGDEVHDDHNCYQSSRIPNNPRTGVPVARLIGYRWHERAERFVQIPFQVDERAVRYLTNNASGFAFYSGADQHTSYVWDVERFRFTSNAASDPCRAAPADGIITTPDPVAGLDDNDELVFMWRDAGPRAPRDAQLPRRIAGAHEIRIDDPSAPGAARYAYVMLAETDGPVADYTAASSPYVRYVRDPDADLFLFSESSYENYGNAPHGPYCAPDGSGPIGFGQRRPKDTAWVYTPRYAFRYEGRWLMTQLRVAPTDLAGPASAPDVYGPDLIDQWKARAFQQRPGGETPCCGFEEEVNNWGGSSILFGERAGPVRVIREVWGADSSTNNNRREVFYAEQIRFIDYLRVHPIPPADGIYVQWDYNAGAVDRYYNPNLPDGVPADGRNDEAFGNLAVHIAPDGVGVEEPDPVPVVGPVSAFVPLPGEGGCTVAGQGAFCNDVDQPDPTFSGPSAALNWEQVSGPYGGWVTRWAFKEHTPGGTPQGVAASPYYRDDACFDDGTGSNPGPHLSSREPDDPTGRTCWQPGEPITGDPAIDVRYLQGAIATHGLHIQLIAEADNANLTVPVTEIDSEQRAVVIPGGTGNVGERYGRGAESPLVATAAPR